MLESARTWLATAIAPKRRPGTAVAKRMYAGAVVNRLTADWVAASTSADSEILTSLRMLRNRARELERDNDYAKSAVRVIRNNVVGQGIGMQAQVMKLRGGKLDDATNAAIEGAFARWCRKENCSTSGMYSFAEILRLAIAAQPTSGEILIRKVRQRFGTSRVPFALEVIESDQLVDNYSVGHTENGNTIKMGVELDVWNRPVAYWMFPKHPGDFNFAGQAPANKYLRVPAEEIIHLYIPDRPGQTRGVPWFHSVLKRFNNMGGYEEAEIIAARASAAIMGFIESPDADPTGADGVQDGERVTNLAPGEVKELGPGEKFNGFAPSRPNAAMDPFMRYNLRGASAGIGISYESISRDYSQSNYSSSRLALLEDRDNWRVLQQWMIENLCQPVFEAWLEMAVLSGELRLAAFETAPEVYQAVRWQPRGWSWVDPLKEVLAMKMAVRCGFSTVADVIADGGGDIEDTFTARRRELDLAADHKLVLETDPAQVNDKGQVQPAEAQQEDNTGETPTGEAVGGGETDSEAKSLTRLFANLEEAMERGQDELAMRLLERIDAVEQLAAKGTTVHVTMPEMSPTFEAVMPVRAMKTTPVRDAAGNILYTVQEPQEDSE